MTTFFIGWHQPTNGVSGCHLFDNTMISINALLKRKSDFVVKDWILDSGAFTRVTDPKRLGQKGKRKGHLSVKQYAKVIVRWHTCGNLLSAASQDYICDSIVLDSTGLTIKDHQSLTIFRYVRLLEELKKLNKPYPHIMPVLQGYSIDDYLRHIDDYGELLKPDMWVGLGSVCSRSSNVGQIESILIAIHKKRPDLKIHGFGLKGKALQSECIQQLLYSADSQAASYAGRRLDARNTKLGLPRVNAANDPRVALEYHNKIQDHPMQKSFLLELMLG